MRRIAMIACLALALAACSRQQPTPAVSGSTATGASAAATAAPSAAATSPAVESRFIPVDTCKVVESKEDEDWSISKCQALPGYTLFLDYGDVRDDLRLIPDGGKEVGLDIPTFGGGGFNSLGPTFEWRGRSANGRFVPHALIVRDTVSEDPAHSEKQTSTLAVIDLKRLCLVALVRPGPDQNRKAQAIADAANRACMSLGD